MIFKNSFFSPSFLSFCCLVSAVAVNTGCTSALKKQCRGTNWFEYGENIAKHGQRASGDTFVQQCEKEDDSIDHARLSQGFQKGLDEYCTPEFAFRVGKQGEYLGNDMCSGAAERQMKLRHEAGVREYCQKSNGTNAGAAGKKYNQICPKDLEPEFLSDFNQGRKRYLAALSARKQAEVRELDQNIRELELKKERLQNDIYRLGLSRRIRQESHYNPRTGKTELVTVDNASTVDNQISGLRWETGKIDQQIQDNRNSQSKLKQEILEAEAEGAAL